MANRPTMKSLQKENQNLSKRVQTLEDNDRATRREIKENKEQIKNLQRNDIIQLLQEMNSPYSQRYRYTYDEIADQLEVSKGTVANIAKEENLSRRSLKSI